MTIDGDSLRETAAAHRAIKVAKAQTLLDEAYKRTSVIHLRMRGGTDVAEDGLTVRIGVEALERLLKLSEIVESTSRGYLTDEELEAMKTSATLANQIRKIIGSGPQSEHDWAETARMIHDLQRQVMAQAAARAYPERFRLLGGDFSPLRPVSEEDHPV